MLEIEFLHIKRCLLHICPEKSQIKTELIGITVLANLREEKANDKTEAHAGTN